jgi:gem associated protein 2
MFVPKACLPVAEWPSRRRKRCQTSNDAESKAKDSTGAGATNVIDAETEETAATPDRAAEIGDDDGASAYLFRVREEAQRLPNVWTADTPPEAMPRVATKCIATRKKAKNADGVFGSMASTLQYIRQPEPNEVAMRDVVPPPSQWHIPTAQQQWVGQIQSSFSELRSYLDQCQLVPTDGAQPPQRQPVPPMKDTVAWCTFCLGHDHGYRENEVAIEVIPAREANGTTWTAAPVAAPWASNIPPLGHAPTVRLLLQMDQVMVRRILEHFTQYIIMMAGTPRKPDVAASSQVYPWIYALLARLAKPIHRDDAVTLYRLLKHLTFLRSQIPEPNRDATPESTSPDRTFLSTLNVLIAIVGIYFEQGGSYTNLMEVKVTVPSSS